VAEHDPVVLGMSARTLVLDHGRRVALDRPGAALRPDVLEPIGLTSPTIVALAAAAGVAPELSFDQDAVIKGLRKTPGVLDQRSFERPAPSSSWTPVREHGPTDVRVENLRHRYDAKIEALRGVSLHFAAGEAVAIIGQNGSGKTTLAKHLNGLLRPTHGRVLVGGTDVAERSVSAIASDVGFVFQSPDDQLFERSVRREVDFGPRNLDFDLATRDRLVEAALAAVDLSGSATTNPYDLDLSQRKLVALASVLAMDPAVVVLDEPTTGQDRPGIRRVGDVVDALRAAGRTVVAITHDMEFAAAHFDRIVVMRQGEVVLDGPPAAVFDAANESMLGTAGVAPPLAARVGARLGVGRTPTLASLKAALTARATTR
jgi:energy-coupling factor transport system ATP-binding protein